MFTSTGKKQSTAAITTFDHGLSVPNHAFVIGANAMIGIAFAAIMYGISALPSGRQRASTSAATNASAASEHEAAERLLERDPGSAPGAASRVVPERSEDVREPRQQEALDPEQSGSSHCQAARPRREDDERGQPVRIRSPSAARRVRRSAALLIALVS